MRNGIAIASIREKLGALQDQSRRGKEDDLYSP
jgi:hypothetical protein